MRKIITLLLLLVFSISIAQANKKFEINTSPEGLYAISCIYNYTEPGFFYSGGFIKVTDSSYNIILKDTCILKKVLLISDDGEEDDERVITHRCVKSSNFFRVYMVFEDEFPSIIKIYDSKGNVIVFEISEVYIFTT